MTSLLALLMALPFLYFGTPQTQQINLALADKVLENSVLIRIKVFRDIDGKRAYGFGGCSGTFINQTQVLTAAHCVADRIDSIWVKPFPTKGTAGFKAHIQRFDSTHDLALLTLEGYRTDKYAKKALSVRVGESVVAVGSPFRFEYLLSEGVVSMIGWKTKEFNSSYIVHTGMVNPGSSGGGLFNEQGELVGCNTMTYGSPFGWAGISLAVSIEDIREFLK